MPALLNRHRLPSWLPMSVLLALVALSLFVWKWVLAYEDRHFQDMLHSATQNTLIDITQHTKDVFHAIDRMKGRWEDAGALSESAWKADAQRMVRDYPTLSALEWADSQGRLRWIAPEGSYPALYGFNLASEPNRAKALHDAARTGKPQLTETVELKQGGRGFLLITPLKQASQGFIVAAFNWDTLLQERIGHILKDYYIVMNEGDKEAFSTLPPGEDRLWEARDSIHIDNAVWTITLIPKPATAAARHSALPVALLLTGLLVSALVAATLHALGKARLRGREARKAMTTLEMYAMELEAANKQAQAATEMKSQFLANMSHEIRTPMNGILGMTHLLLGMQMNQEQKSYLETINHSAAHLLRLLNDILDLSKIDAQELIIEPNAFDIEEHFRQTVRLLEPLALSKQIELRWHAEGLPETVEGDAVRFAQIVTNLTGNAIKFTDSGSVTVALSYDEAQQSIRCDIEDTGIGIPESAQENIFEQFAQADSSIGRRFGGSGLGLTITRKLISALGGQMGFTSAPGRGSHFWFTLPMRRALWHKPISPAAYLPVEQHSLIPLQEARLLVAEDHPVNRMFMARLLERFGFRHVELAGNGQEVVDRLLSGERFDAIFMDCQMPVVDGFEATRRIRAMEGESRYTKIIAMTANALAGDKERCFQAGMDEYVSKPLQPEQLRDMLAAWFDLSPAPSHAALQPGATPPIDLDRLSLTARNQEEEAEVLGMFFELAKENMGHMRFSRRAGERTDWKAAAHFLCGAAANLGMSPLADLCRSAEQAEGSNAEEQLLAIASELERVQAYLRQQGKNWLISAS